jgi:pimeloyl-ACP methyl ester carboxylesterase
VYLRRPARRLAGPHFSKRVVVLPGFMGSVLKDTRDGTEFWGSVEGLLELFNPSSLVERLGQGDGIDDPGHVAATRPIRLDPPFNRLGLNSIEGAVNALREVVGRERVKVFAYDWRLRNENAARGLLRRVRGHFADAENDPSRRGTLVAHSMGGLVSRYCIEELEGWRWVDRLVTVGTPHHGVVNSLIGPTEIRDIDEALRGFGFKVNFFRRFLAVAYRLGSLVQLVPTFDYYLPEPDAKEPEPWQTTEQRLPTDPAFNMLLGKPGAAKSLIRGPHFETLRGFTFVLERNRQDLDAVLDERKVEYVTIGSRDHETSVAIRNLGSGKLAKVQRKDGDGTVPIVSALLPEGPRVQRMIVPTKMLHSTLFQDPMIQRICLGTVTRGESEEYVRKKGWA